MKDHVLAKSVKFVTKYLGNTLQVRHVDVNKELNDRNGSKYWQFTLTCSHVHHSERVRSLNLASFCLFTVHQSLGARGGLSCDLAH